MNSRKLTGFSKYIYKIFLYIIIVCCTFVFSIAHSQLLDHEKLANDSYLKVYTNDEEKIATAIISEVGPKVATPTIMVGAQSYQQGQNYFHCPTNSLKYELGN